MLTLRTATCTDGTRVTLVKRKILNREEFVVEIYSSDGFPETAISGIESQYFANVEFNRAVRSCERNAGNGNDRP
jgi:hypothetical protein